MKTYTMPQAVLTRLKTKHKLDEIICHHPECDEPIEVDDKVVSFIHKNKLASDKVAIWHKECYDSTVHDI